jgi:hypothetical protein
MPIVGSHGRLNRQFLNHSSQNAGGHEVLDRLQEPGAATDTEPLHGELLLLLHFARCSPVADAALN